MYNIKAINKMLLNTIIISHLEISYGINSVYLMNLEHNVTK